MALALSVLVGLPLGASTASAAAVSVDLCATAGSMTLAGAGSITVWGYTDCSVGSTVTKPGGPTLQFTENDVVSITLHNNLSVATGLVFPGVPQPPDRTGVASGGTKLYNFTVNKPGTFLYQAALLPKAQYQVAMGLYGAMSVLPSPATGKAYADAVPTTQDSTFTTEATLVLSEIDPALNNAPNPATFNMRNFAPRYGLINGAAHPNTTPIPAVAGDKVLLRYVNAGLKLHSMAALGVRQNVIAYDGNELRYPHKIVAETFGPGQTTDVIATVPALAPAGSRYAIYDGSLSLHNSSAGNGGMLTFISVGSSTTPSTAPTTSAVTLSPNPTNGTTDVTVSATITANDGAEYFIDTVGAGGSGTLLTTPISVANLAVLSAGTHVVYVHGHNANGWGPVASAPLNLDKAGPATSGLSLVPAISNGTGTVTLNASGSDAATGGANVTGGAYTIDGGAPGALLPSGPVAVATALKATIAVGALTEGTHVVSVTSTDFLFNSGPASTITLLVDKTGPVATPGTTTASPNPSNGAIGVSSGVPAVRITSTFTDPLSNIAGAEGFIEGVGANGAGFVFTPSDGVWGPKVSTGTNQDRVFADIPLATVAALSDGPHTISVHAKDAAGNWGALTTVTLTLDRTAPTVGAVTALPSPANNTAVVVSAPATDGGVVVSNIGGGEFFIDTAGATGTGSAMTPAAASSNTTISGTIPAATVTGMTVGSHTIFVHAKDAAGNWSSTVTGTLLIDRVAPTFASITLSPNAIVPNVPATIGLTVNGSVASPGTTVAGGEYWIGTSNIAAGSGTAFSGLTPSISTGALSAGTYTVWVRLKDNLGNWSVAPNNGVRTATLTVAPDTIAPTFTSITLSPATIAVGTASVGVTVNGVADAAPSSGVTGGEYWIDGTLTPGSAPQTAFTGVTVPAVPTAGLSVGIHQVRVRIRDAAGNWSTGVNGVRTAGLTVAPVAIFANGFEAAASPWGWSSVSTGTTARLNRTAAAVLDGAFGLQAQANNTNYVQYNFGTPAQPAAPIYDASFLFKSNGATSTGKDIFTAATNNGFAAPVLRVRYRISAGQAQVQVQVGNTANAIWVNIDGAVVNTIEVAWNAGTNLRLFVNGTVMQTLATANTNSVGAVRLGSVTANGNATAMFFDKFLSQRTIP